MEDFAKAAVDLQPRDPNIGIAVWGRKDWSYQKWVIYSLSEVDASLL